MFCNDSQEDKSSRHSTLLVD
uniref:Uncharacterized protein n=1 Tax=Moniliophthora roreri TaxID=221103 RepID=A0A0W0GEM9_MONRR